VPLAASNVRWNNHPPQEWSLLLVGMAHTNRGTVECAVTKSATTVDGVQESGFAEKRVLLVHGVEKTNIVNLRVLLAMGGAAQNLKRIMKVVIEVPNAAVANATRGGVCTKNADQRRAGKTTRTVCRTIIANHVNVSTPLAQTKNVCQKLVGKKVINAQTTRIAGLLPTMLALAVRMVN